MTKPSLSKFPAAGRKIAGETSTELWDGAGFGSDRVIHVGFVYNGPVTVRTTVGKASLNRREFIACAASGSLAAVLPACAPPPLIRTPGAPQTSPPTTLSHGSVETKLMDYRRLPRWRGFNLLEKFLLQYDKPYREWDFDFMARFGFDFVRLPTDYRIWTIAPGQFREEPLKQIDQAIEWARQRKIHVNLSLHRAPGYCVNREPPEALDLWGDGSSGEAAREQFAEQWRMFASRYHGIPSGDLSFNLVNEPAATTGAQYLRAAKLAVAAIRESDSSRLIIADGTNYGRTVVPELTELQIAQSTRGYDPMLLTHHQASWVEGADRWPVPTWPVIAGVNQYLYGPMRSEFNSPLVLRGNFAVGAELSIAVNEVSDHAKLVIYADGKSVFQKSFKPGEGKGEWKKVVYKPEAHVFLGKYEHTYVARLAERCHEIRIELVEGDWLTFGELTVGGASPGPARIVPDDVEWGIRQREFTVSNKGEVAPLDDRAALDGEALYKAHVKPWLEFSNASRIGIHVGEWGAYRKTPHDVVLRWMKDCLANWKRAGIGWALWNLRGDFGCLDSNRDDVRYEDYEGHKLDRQMLELLTSDQ